jgi:hypothetical protein
MAVASVINDAAANAMRAWRLLLFMAVPLP